MFEMVCIIRMHSSIVIPKPVLLIAEAFDELSSYFKNLTTVKPKANERPNKFSKIPFHHQTICRVQYYENYLVSYRQ